MPEGVPVLVQHSSPLGTLYVPALGVDVALGVPVVVPDPIAASLLEQADLWHVSEEN
jgi:hypothetical protein